MSSSYSFYKVSKIEGDVPKVITVGSSYLEDNDIFSVHLESAQAWMKDIGRRTIIEYKGLDYDEICFLKFGSKFNRISYKYPGGSTFYLENKELGYIDNQELKSYEKVINYEALLFKSELIASPEHRYALYGMECRLYTESELLDIAYKIENDEEYPVSMYEHEALYALYKAALLASKGNKIWCEVS